jgi:hypothetical protein
MHTHLLERHNGTLTHKLITVRKAIFSSNMRVLIAIVPIFSNTTQARKRTLQSSSFKP